MFIATEYAALNIVIVQWRSQNAEKVTHIEGRLLDQAVILFNCVPFWNGNFCIRERICFEAERILSFKQWKITFTTLGDILWMLLFYYARA